MFSQVIWDDFLAENLTTRANEIRARNMLNNWESNESACYYFLQC